MVDAKKGKGSEGRFFEEKKKKLLCADEKFIIEHFSWEIKTYEKKNKLREKKKGDGGVRSREGF